MQEREFYIKSCSYHIFGCKLDSDSVNKSKSFTQGEENLH